MPVSPQLARATTRSARVLGFAVTATLIAFALAPSASAHNGGSPDTAKKRA